MAVKPIIIPLVADPSGLEPGIDALEALGKVDKDAAAKFREANKAFQERKAAVEEAKSSTDKLTSSIDKLTETILGAALKKGKDDAKKYGDEVEKTSEEFKVLVKTIALAKAELDKLQKGTPAFEKLSQEIEAAEMAMGNFKNEAKSSRAQLKQYREALNQLEEAGLENTQVFQDMAVTAGQLQDQIGDTQARIRALASDTFKLDASIQIIQGVAGAFSVAQGAAALFGEESEDIQQALLRVNAAMSILNGLQQLQNILQRQSAASLFVENALRRISAASTTLQSLAESRFTVVRWLAVQAQTALNSVMAANPAGVLLLAISAAAGALLFFTNSSETAAEAQEKLAEQQKKVVEALNEEIDAQERLRNTREGGLNAIRQEISELQARGGARSKIIALEGKALDEEIQNAKVRQQSLAGLSKAENDYNKVSDEIAKLRSQRALKSIEEQEALQDELLKSATASAEARVSAAKKGSQAELEAQIEAIRVAQRAQLSAESLTVGEREKIIADNERKISDLRLQIQVKFFDDQIALAEAKAVEYESTYIDTQNRLRAIAIKYDKDRIGATQEQEVALQRKKNEEIIKVYQEQRGAFAQIEEEIGLIILKAQRDMLGKEKEQRILIETQANESIRALRLKFFGDIENAQRDHNTRTTNLDKERILQGAKNAQDELDRKRQNALDQQKATEDRVKKEKELELHRYEFALQTASSLAQSLTEISRNNADAQIAIEQQRLEQGLITQEQFDQRSRAIRRKAAVEEKQMALFQAAIAQSLAILSILKDQTIPAPAKPLFIALASAQALAQLAAIASKPIPQFAKGTKYKPESGPAIIGESGPELYYAHGKWGYASQATLLNLPKGAKVIPTLETEKILQRYNIPMPNISQQVNNTYGGVKIDYNKLGSVIGKQIGKLPVQVNNWDGKGFSQYQTSLSRRRSHLNNKFRSPGK